MSQEYPSQQPTPPPGPTGQWRDRMDSVARDIEGRGRELVREGNARRLIVEYRSRDLANLPLTVAVIIGAVTLVASAPLAILAVIAALFARVRVRIEG